MAVEGWRDARRRLSVAMTPTSSSNPNIPLAEALYWLAAIEDDAQGKTPTESDSYFATRDASTNGKTVGGLIFARNLVTHELLIPIKPEPVGAYGAAPYGTAPYGGGTQWRWKSRIELGSPIDKHGCDISYDDHVAGRGVGAPLQAAEDFFGL